jgi:6-phosphogluconolactonase
LLNSGRISLLFFGADKRAVYEAAKVGTSLREYPVRVVLRQDRVPVTVYWVP